MPLEAVTYEKAMFSLKVKVIDPGVIQKSLNVKYEVCISHGLKIMAKKLVTAKGGMAGLRNIDNY